MDQSVRLVASSQATLLRAARAMLDWSLVEAGRRASLSVATVLAAEERGTRPASSAERDQLRRAYEAAGVSFLDDCASSAGIRIVPRSETSRE